MAGSNVLTNLIDFVSKSAPLLGTLLGSPVAGIGISLLASHLGVDPKTPDAILASLQNDPQADLKLKNLEDEHSVEMAKVAVSQFQIEASDKSSAREMAISTHDKVPTILAIGFLLAYAAIQAYCVSHTNSTNDIISARFQDILIMIISFYFGSSHEPPKAA